MRWKGRKQSTNVEDRRRGGGTTKKVGASLGIGTVILVILALVMGENPLQLLQQVQPPVVEQTQSTNKARADDELASFVKVVLQDTEDVWNKLFPEQFGGNYRTPTLVIFDGQVQSACGFASAATGPFYCPGDQKLYIDLSFYRDLKEKFKAPGDFAMAYVVAHEVAHHVQNLLGITGKVQNERRRISKAEYNKLSVKLELQADFLAGVWAHHAHKLNNILEPGDLEEALRAAAAIGDDRIQKQSKGYVVPEAFTHGTSEQRVRWFRRGLETGDVNQGDTFSARSL